MIMSGLGVTGMVPMCSIKGMLGGVEVLDATTVLRSLILVVMLGLESGVCMLDHPSYDECAGQFYG